MSVEQLLVISARLGKMEPQGKVKFVLPATKDTAGVMVACCQLLPACWAAITASLVAAVMTMLEGTHCTSCIPMGL